MTTPQQPELRRSGETSISPNDDINQPTGAVATDPNQPDTPVPEANQPGSPSGPVQDKPDLDAFARRAAGEDAEEGSAGTGVVRRPDVAPVVASTLRFVARSVAAAARGLDRVADRVHPHPPRA